MADRAYYGVEDRNYAVYLGDSEDIPNRPSPDPGIAVLTRLGRHQPDVLVYLGEVLSVDQRRITTACRSPTTASPGRGTDGSICRSSAGFVTTTMTGHPTSSTHRSELTDPGAVIVDSWIAWAQNRSLRPSASALMMMETRIRCV